jgi:hypothetical protein
MELPSIDSKNHPLNILKSIGKYDQETGYTPHIAGESVTPTQEERNSATSVGCGSCGGGKVR